MNYDKIYKSLCEKVASRDVSGAYTEKHHVVPKCLGGSNRSHNLVRLFPREHYFAHKLLCRIYPNNLKLAFALVCMGSKGAKSAVGHIATSRDYENSRIRFSELLKEQHPKKGKKLSEERRREISEKSPRLSGKEHPMYGKRHKESSKALMSNNAHRTSGEDHPMFGVKHTEETRKKMSDAYAKRVRSQWNFDKKIYTLRNIETGEVFVGFRFDFCRKYNLPTTNGALTHLLKGRIKKLKGWTLEKINNDSTT